jgi:hypothetical protein
MAKALLSDKDQPVRNAERGIGRSKNIHLLKEQHCFDCPNKKTSKKN